MKLLIQKIASRYIRANLSPQTEKFLTSLAKGSLVNVPQKILIESLETLGFRITQVTATREINDQEFLHWCKSNKLYGNVVDQYRNILALPTLEKHSKVTLGKPPSSPKVNHLYLTVKKEVKFDGVEIHVPQEVYLGTKGLEIQGSKTFTYTGEMGLLWKFLQEENVFSLAQDYLGIDENQNSSQQRTLENTGLMAHYMTTVLHGESGKGEVANVLVPDLLRLRLAPTCIKGTSLLWQKSFQRCKISFAKVNAGSFPLKSLPSEDGLKWILLMTE